MPTHKGYKQEGLRTFGDGTEPVSSEFNGLTWRSKVLRHGEISTLPQATKLCKIFPWLRVLGEQNEWVLNAPLVSFIFSLF